MLYDPTTAQHLKPWLVRTLEPICDAEPGALAEYILALLKHNVPENEMRKELSSQLEEFLEKEGPSFIDTLFTVLRTKSYLPYTAGESTSPFSLPSHSQSADTGIPIPLDALLSNHSPTPQERGQKRSMLHDDRDGRPPTKGPRLSAEGQFSRYSNGRSTGAWGGGQNRPGGQGIMMNGAMGSGMNGSNQNMNNRRPQNYQPPDQRKGICRDYHNNGYCARGALCKYSHGDDAFVPSQVFPMNGNVPFLPMFGGMPFGMTQGAPYDPHEARMDMHPNGIGMGRGMQQRAPLLPRVHDDSSQVVHAVDRSGELPVIQDLTPQLPPESAPTAPAADRIPQNSTPVQQHPIQPMDVEVGISSMSGPSTYNTRGGFGGMRGAPRGRGVFGGDAQTFRPERRQDKTLVVEKIPEDKLNRDAVISWFKRFGTVTNVAIDVRSAKALVSFSDHSEAHAAWKSEDAVFGNRFVKVFWHRPMEGHGQQGSKMLAASAPLLANLAARDAHTPSAPVQPPAPHATTPARKPPLQSTAASELAAKRKLLEQQIAEQKSLMVSLETASADEKKEILARLRKLGEEMKIASVPSSSATPAKAHSPERAPTAQNDHEKKERERLDKELELHAVGESTEELKAKLAKLREEAASLGISATNADTSHGTPSYRGYRGRGRGARSTFYRGAARGGPPRASMKLDNRPKKLLVKGVREDAVQALRDWYETTGQLESADIIGDDEVLVSFRTRAAAEQGFAKGSDIAAVGSVKVSWHTAQQSQARPEGVSVPSPQPATTKDAIPEDMQSVSPTQGRRPSPRPQEEEVVASGWGDGDEDGMGMF
ncbi:hypothetical protein AZE42_02559 [Rhizopogon vesiculosus]|uniref:C3H1-type domain-containing protein n=1 Tax=Rhizopogon vesiculosus TaxID=180088 RepID=A0A1J8Q5Z6_9AGAM|nr:hypothetical protein AZE42_02559 [Rhizopogon vesiculosus]